MQPLVLCVRRRRAISSSARQLRPLFHHRLPTRLISVKPAPARSAAPLHQWPCTGEVRAVAKATTPTGSFQALMFQKFDSLRDVMDVNFASVHAKFAGAEKVVDTSSRAQGSRGRQLRERPRQVRGRWDDKFASVKDHMDVKFAKRKRSRTASQPSTSSLRLQGSHGLKFASAEKLADEKCKHVNWKLNALIGIFIAVAGTVLGGKGLEIFKMPEAAGEHEPVAARPRQCAGGGAKGSGVCSDRRRGEGRLPMTGVSCGPNAVTLVPLWRRRANAWRSHSVPTRKPRGRPAGL